MKIWIDAQLPPAVAPWITENFDEEARAIRELGLREAKDKEIFFAARKEDAIVMTKDSDFLLLIRSIWNAAKHNLDHVREHGEYEA